MFAERACLSAAGEFCNVFLLLLCAIDSDLPDTGKLLQMSQ